jgi:hypothetical protein
VYIYSGSKYQKKEDFMANGDEREFIFIKKAVFDLALDKYENDKSNNRQMQSKFLLEAFYSLNESSFGGRGRQLLLFGKLEYPGIIYYSDGSMSVDQANQDHVFYLLHSLQINVSDYQSLWDRGGVLFIINEEPIDILTNRARKYIESRIEITNHSGIIKLHFMVGVPLYDIYLPSDLIDQQKNKLIQLFIDYQIGIDKQLTIANSVLDKRMEECFRYCEKEREVLFKSIQTEGWRYPILNNQAYNLKYKEWNYEENKWNVHMVDAVFTRI